jgi:hypothetical protein
MIAGGAMRGVGARGRRVACAQLAAAVAVAMAAAALSAPALAAETLPSNVDGAGFSIGSIAQPTLFSSSRNEPCETTLGGVGALDGVVELSSSKSEVCDSYTVTVRNEGAGATGIAKVGESETCEPGEWEDAPASYSYEWVRGPLTLSGASVLGRAQSYTVAAEDAGYALTCVATATNAYGSVAASSMPLYVAPRSTTVPSLALVVEDANIERPIEDPRTAVVGYPHRTTVSAGEVLQCEPAVWRLEGVSGKYEVQQEYRWLVNGTPTNNEETEAFTPEPTFVVPPSAAGAAIQCESVAQVFGGGLLFGETAVPAVSGDRVLAEPAPSGEPPAHSSEALSLADVPSVSGATVTVKDTLPAGVTPVAIGGGVFFHDEGVAEQLHCDFATLSCALPAALPPGGGIELRTDVTVQQSEGELSDNRAEVTGGSTPARASTQEPEGKIASTPIGRGEPAFAVEDFSFQAFGTNGLPDAQAGDHPNAVTVSFQLPTIPPEDAAPPGGQLKDVRVDLPLGLVGDPLVAERCPEYDIVRGANESNCPPGSLVGALVFTERGENVAGEEQLPIYNVTPQAGYPAEFATVYDDREVPFFANVIPAPGGGGYDLQVTSPGIPTVALITDMTITFFGVPAQHSGGETGQAFLTNPVTCGSVPKARIEVDSWQSPGDYRAAEAPLYGEGQSLSGCSLLQFGASLEVAPEPTSRLLDTPSGYEAKLTIPQAQNMLPTLATPELEDVDVALPEGVAVSPSAANGLQACSPAQIAIGAQEVNGAGHEDGQEHAVPGHCPGQSQIGSMQIVTPLLEHPLTGHVYLAEPQCGGAGQPACSPAAAEEGKLFGLYLEASGAGVIVKLAGQVHANASSGRLTATFDENPQLPFSELTLKFNNGQRAPLANPQACGVYTTSALLEPWSGRQLDASTTNSFSIDGCAGPTPFAPSFDAGTTSTGAGAYTNFTLTLSRKDGEQDLARIALDTPPGLLGMVAHVPLCGEPQAQEGDCPAASRIGATNVAAGAGSEPYWLHGSVYLTGPYAGAPFGLSIVVPAVAGPFNLGNEVVRAAIGVNPATAALTVLSDPLPQSKDGVPFRLKEVNVEVNHPEFMRNPTDCEQQSLDGEISGAAGTTTAVSTPFAASNCAILPFNPSFTVSTQGKTSKADGASLTVEVTQKPGEANVHKVELELPLVLPSRLSTLQKACTEAQFNANPADCPAASVIGTAKAVTPVLQTPLTGPAYLVSRAAAAFPDVEFVLQADERGGDVEIVLDGKTQIKQGITYSRFETVPDAPIDSFEANLPEGPYSVFTTAHPGRTNLCAQKLLLPLTITGQNGAVIKQAPRIEVMGCRYALSVSSHSIRDRTLTLHVVVPAAGKLTASGTGLQSTSKSAGGRETLVLTVKQTQAERLATTIRLGFTPKQGRRLAKSLSVTFKR